MITDRVRFKNLRAGRVLEVLERMQYSDEKKYDSETIEAIAQKIDKMAFIDDGTTGTNLLSQWEVNEPFEVADLLNHMNHLINTLYRMSDSDYYFDYIFNAGMAINKGVAELGITEEWLMELADKFEKLRSLLYGDCIDWNEMSITLMRNAAYSLREDNNRLEDRNKSLEYKQREIEKNRRS